MRFVFHLDVLTDAMFWVLLTEFMVAILENVNFWEAQLGIDISIEFTVHSSQNTVEHWTSSLTELAVKYDDWCLAHYVFYGVLGLEENFLHCIL